MQIMIPFLLARRIFGHSFSSLSDLKQVEPGTARRGGYSSPALQLYEMKLRCAGVSIEFSCGRWEDGWVAWYKFSASDDWTELWRLDNVESVRSQEISRFLESCRMKMERMVEAM